jgi:cell pole-organizing protein PopZ
MRQQGEASVEEILESIKKVIARDNREGALEARRRRDIPAEPEGPADLDDGEEEVLELDAGAMVADASDAVAEAEGDDDAEGEPLVTEAARESMRDNLAALAMLAEPGARPQIVRSGETSLEGLVREMLRPMLGQWLDTNLPPMVERMVRDEIARIAGKKG